MNSIADRIVKLRKMAEDKSVTEEEAQLFASKVAELLGKHNLSMSDIVTDRNYVTEDHWHTTYCDPWRRSVIRAAAQLYFCDVYLRKWFDAESRVIRDGIVLVGKPNNIFVAREMGEYLINTVMRLAIQYSKDNPSRHYTQRKVRLSFERGCGEALAKRLRDMRAAREAGEKVSTEGNPGNLPALYESESVKVREYIDDMKLPFGNRRHSKLDDSHALAGVHAADDVSLADQITVADPGDPV